MGTRSHLLALPLAFVAGCGPVQEPTASSVGAWSSGAIMAAGRWDHTATTIFISDPAGFPTLGPVVVAGGQTCAGAGPESCGALASVETYLTPAGVWFSLPDMHTARWGHTAVQLDDWGLLVVGGEPATAGRSVERFSQFDLGSWYVMADLNHPRAFHTATLLRDSRLLVVGGTGCEDGTCGPVAVSEVYHSVADAWTDVGALATSRAHHTATFLADGRVLVVGGQGASGASLASAEIFDPALDTFVATGSLARARHDHTAALVGGRVLVTGGVSCPSDRARACATLHDAELYDPATGTWSDGGRMDIPRAEHATAPLPTCRLLLAGGEHGNGHVILDRVATWDDGFDRASHMDEPRSHHTANALPGGKVLVTGGRSPRSFAGATSSEVFDVCGEADCTFAGVPACGCPSACPDTDGDGLSDAWETTGIDIDCDGAIDLDLAALGADPRHKDVFIEVDYMAGDIEAPPHSHVLMPEAQALVEDAFAAAPVDNPDGLTGVRLHIIIDEELPEARLTSFGSCVPGRPFVDASDLKAQHFRPERAPAFHWALMAHRGCDFMRPVGGLGAGPGNDFYISLGFECDADGCHTTPFHQAHAFMHELGHNLGLGHAGDPLQPRQDFPNYLSVMGRAPDRIDYSHEALPPLDETMLDESLGIQDGDRTTSWNCEPGRCGQPDDSGVVDCRTGPANGPLDWNCNGVIDPFPVAADVNGDGELTTLPGYDDWAALIYAFQCVSSQRDLVRPPR